MLIGYNLVFQLVTLMRDPKWQPTGQTTFPPTLDDSPWVSFSMSVHMCYDKVNKYILIGNW